MNQKNSFKIDGLLCYLKMNGSAFDEVSKMTLEIQGSNVNFGTNGKLGKCAYIGGASGIKLPFSKNYYSNLTMSFWLNKSSWPTNGYNTIYSSRGGGSGVTVFGGNNDNGRYYFIPGTQYESFITAPSTGS